MELCKFYVLETCSKQERCSYLHQEFPCKYYHTGQECTKSTEMCKFSHDNLTNETREILLKHLETAPQELLGNFPRIDKEKTRKLVYITEALNKDKCMPHFKIDKPK